MKNTKRIIAGVLSVTLMCGSLALPAAQSGITLFDTAITADAETYGDYEYVILDDGTVEITGYTGQGGDITIPGMINEKKVTRIGNYAFLGCDIITSVTIADGITSIGDSAFSSSDNLTSVTIPGSVKSIGSGAFDYCESFASINVDENNSTFSSVDGVLFSKDKTKLILYPMSSSRRLYSIPNGTKIIGDEAFLLCENLIIVIIPDSVTEIGEGAFSCSGVKQIEIPNSVTTIRKGTFSNSWLSSITIPDSVTKIEDYAFSDCKSLKEVTIPKSVTSIEKRAFGNYNGKGFREPDNLTIRCYIGSAAEKYAKENYFNYNYADKGVPAVNRTIANGFSCSTTAIRIKWNKVENASGYRIYRQDRTTKKWEKVATLSGGDTLTYRQSGLESGTRYNYKVKAYAKKNGQTYWGATSDPIYAATKPKAVKITKTSASTTAVRLGWSMVKCYDYEVQVYNPATKKWGYIRTIGDKPDNSPGITINKETGFMEWTESRISGLKKNKSYKFRVRAYSINDKPGYDKFYGEWTYVTVRTKA